MLIIGLGHKARQGKGECVQALLQANQDGRFGKITTLSFAGALREEVMAAAHQLYEQNFGPDHPFNGHAAMRMVCAYFDQPFEENPLVDATYPYGKQRVLLQWYGTEYRRAQDKDYWVKRGMYSAANSGADLVVFDDVRFPNEYTYIGAAGGVRVKVSRLGWKSDVPEHESETALNDHAFDVSLAVADGRLPLLKSTFVHLVGELTSTPI
jgi:hypothetical protein